MFKFFSGMLDRLSVVFGAIIFLQVPEFFFQYTQRLGGHVAELKIQIAQIQKQATQLGKELPEYLNKFRDHLDPEIAAHGRFLDDLFARYDGLSGSYSQLYHSSSLGKPYVFLKTFDLEIARTTLSEFHVGLPINLESFFYGVIGMILGYGLYNFFGFIVKKIAIQKRTLYDHNH